jgi:hypothetical protein
MVTFMGPEYNTLHDLFIDQLEDLYDAEKRRERAISPPLFKPVPPDRLLPEARPSLLIFSSLLAILVGFVSGLVVKRGNR